MIGVAAAARAAGELQCAGGDFGDVLNSLYRRLLFLPEQASTFARAIDTLHYAEITILFGMGAVVALVAGYCLLRFRRDGAPTRTPRLVAPLWFELVVYPGMFVFFVVLWVVGFRQYLAMAEAPPDALEVYVVGKQWTWKFSYADGPSSVGTLVVPEGRPVRLLLTSRDVVHSFYVPAFRVKRDAVPGLWTTAWFEAREPGRFRIFCAEMCGAGHSRMWGEVAVLTPEAFARWMHGEDAATDPLSLDGPVARSGAAAMPPLGGMAARGRAAAAASGCLRCHSSDGQPHLGPTWLGLYGKQVLLSDGRRTVADAAYLTRSMMDPEQEVVAGYQPVMPSYQGLLDPSDAAAIVEYVKSLSADPSPQPRDPLPTAPVTLVPGRDGTLAAPSGAGGQEHAR